MLSAVDAAARVSLAELIAAPPVFAAGGAEVVDSYDMAAFECGMPGLRAVTEVGEVRQLEPGDVLLSRSATAPRRAWVVGQNKGRPQVASKDWLVLRSEGFEPSYLRHLLVSNDFHQQARRLAPNAGRAQGSGKALWSSITVPQPAREQQCRIARALDTADALRARRASSLCRHRALPQSLLNDVFGATPQAAFPRVPLAELSTEPVRRGLDVALLDHGRFPVVRAGDVLDDTVDPAHCRHVAHSDEALARTALSDGDIVLARDPGDPGKVAAAIAYPGAAVWFVHARVYRLRIDRRQACPEYVRAILATAWGQQGLLQAWREADARSRVDRRIEAFHIPLPALSLQQAFVERVLAARRLQARMLASSERLDVLLNTLRNLAFRGELPSA